MKTEIEVKFIDIDIDVIRQRLQDVGAECEQPMRLMRRALIETDAMTQENAFLRLRDEGHRTTLTYKMFKENSLTGAREHEVTVSDYDTMHKILLACGFEFQTTQESKRETWRLGEVEIVIDQWPWMKPYIEIEAETESAVRETAVLLGFDWEDAVFGSADVVYHIEYPNMSVRGVVDIPSVRFDDPVPPEFLG